MTITLIFLDKHMEVFPLEEAKRICNAQGGVIMDAETKDKATKNELRTIIDRDTWLIERRRTGNNEPIQRLCIEA